MIVRATSLGDVHTHDALPGDELASRDLAQAPRAHGHSRQLVRLSVGIEAVEDIIADLEQAL